ncbi:hypothetical protein [Gordonia effusa]|nr:hypothetical protein [Gordonia effusa]
MRVGIALSLFVVMCLTMIGLGLFTTTMWVLYLLFGIAELAGAAYLRHRRGSWLVVATLLVLGVYQLVQGIFWRSATAEQINSAIPIDNVGAAMICLLAIVLVLAVPLTNDPHRRARGL